MVQNSRPRRAFRPFRPGGLCWRERPQQQPSMQLLGALSLGEVKEHDAGRIANGRVVTGEGQPTRSAVYVEDGDVVVALVARIKKPSRRVKIEAVRVISARPFLAHEL